MALMVEVVTKSEAQKVVCTTVVKISANLTVNYCAGFSGLGWFFWFLSNLFINSFKGKKLVMEALISLPHNTFSLRHFCVCMQTTRIVLLHLDQLP